MRHLWNIFKLNFPIVENWTNAKVPTEEISRHQGKQKGTNFEAQK